MESEVKNMAVSKELDAAIKKTSQLIALLEQAKKLIASLGTVNTMNIIETSVTNEKAE